MDIGEGVDTDTVRFFEEDEVELDATCSSQQEGSASCLPTADLPEGEIQLFATVQDFNGNLSVQAQVSFAVDTTPPIISFDSPLEGAILNTATPTIELSYSDDENGESGSGVDTGTLVMRVNGNLLNNCTIDPDDAEKASCTPALLEGLNTLTATIQDLAGNPSAQAQVSVFVDTVRPVITFVSPVEGAVLNTSTPKLELSFGDLGSGVSTGTLAIIQANGTPLAVRCNFLATSATCTPTSSFPEGDLTLTATIADVAGNVSPPAQVSFTVDTTVPEILFTSPAEGSTVNTDTPELVLSLSDSGVGVDNETLAIIQANGAPLAVTCNFDLPNPTCTPTIQLSPGLNTLTATIQDLAGNPSAPAELSFTVQLTVPGFPVLDPIGNQTVPLGSTLTLNLTATDLEGDPLAFSAAPLPLPENSSLNAFSGLFTFTPSADQVGVIHQTFIVSDGARADSETIEITVQGAPMEGSTSFTGRVLDANDFEMGTTTPVVGATISFLGTGLSAVSDGQGNFTVTELPVGSQVLDIDTSTADSGPDGALYGGFREELELIAGVNNIVERPFFLPRIDVSSLKTVVPNTTTIVENTTLGVTLEIPPFTALNPDGSFFTGQLSISLVPRDLAPAALPDFLDPGLLITIQPVGITFTTPVPITFPNIDGLPAFSEVNLWSLDPEFGVFSVVGTGIVSAEEDRIETRSGGIKATDWHAAVPPPSLPDVEASDTLGPILDDRRAARCKCTSVVQVQNGSIEVNFSLPTYRSLGVSRSLRFVYATSWANPRPVLPFNSTIPVRTAIPQTLSYRLSVAGIAQGTESFVNTLGLSNAIDETLRNAVSFEGSTYRTGLYPYTLRLTNNYVDSRISTDINGQILVRNESESPFGTGWAIDGVERIFTNSDGSLSVVSSQGALILFTPEETSPPFVNFFPPAGDFSTLVKNVEGTFTRTLKDGTRIGYDSDGRQSSWQDQNGNTTNYLYDADGRLTSITDAANLVTTFTYSGNFLSSVLDPASRTTLFTHDALGNLIQVTFPDGTTRSFGYDGRNLMISEINERDFEAVRQYDNFGRFVTGTRTDGTTALASNLQSVGLVDPASGVGTEASPAPVLRPDEAQSTLTDGRGNTVRFETDRFGAITQQITTVERINRPGRDTFFTRIERDENGNPTRIQRPNSAITTMTYDSVGNLLTSRNPLTVPAITSFTYDAEFNQVLSITDPNGNLTTINYDENGNPIGIIDALNNETVMTYEDRGLLTSVTSAVGTPEQNTTSFTYDGNGNLLTTTDPLGRVTTLEYDSAGNVSRSIDAENQVTEFTYDLMNRLISVLDAKLNVTQYDYDARGNLTQVTDARNQTTSFTYDEMDRRISATNPLGLTETFTHDANGNLISTTNRNEKTVTFAYDDLNRLVQKTLPPNNVQLDPQITDYGYDRGGNLNSVINAVADVNMNYDRANRLTSSITFDPDGGGDIDPIYTYDLNGNRITMREPTATTTYTYDALNRLTSMTNPSGDTTAFTYDALSCRTSMTHDNGVVSTYTYDAASQLLSLVHQMDATTINSSTYTYDDVGNRLSKTDDNGTASYTYDSLNRLVEAMNPLPSDPLEAFTYDEVGNRVDSNRNGLSTFNLANQLAEDSDFTYTYDANGNQIQKRDKATLLSTQFEYDAENQLIRVVREDSSVVNYTYDGLGRRIEKDVAGVITRYIYDNEDILFELDGTSTIVARYTHGPGVDETLILERDLDTSGTFEVSERFFYHADGLGSVTELTDSTGTVVQTYVYDSFGQIVQQVGTLANPYTYTGREFDEESGLYYYRARYYDSTTGRFLQEDLLLGSPRFPQSLNKYVYVTNNPVLFVDPFGLLNFLIGGGYSGVAGFGGEVSGGIVITFGPGFDFDIGLFSSVGVGSGFNLSGDVFFGLVAGNLSDVSSNTLNVNVAVLGNSAALFIDPTTSEVRGGTFGLGSPGASVTLVKTRAISLIDLLRDFIGSVSGSSFGGQLESCVTE